MVYKSCDETVEGDYLLALAKAAYLPTREERGEAIAEARDEFREAMELCEDQLEARTNLCGLLNETVYHPILDPADFEEGVENPFFPLTPGVTRVYEVETDEGLEQVVVEVTHDTREILGIECVVVRDTAYLDGEVIEDTFDYHACDRFGNVWYLGENTAEYEEGYIVSTEGAWIAGEDGAKPGVIMPAIPQIGQIYRQEFALGEAEDVAAVVSLGETVTVPFGTYNGCLVTEDYTPISPGDLEFKSYAPDVGPIKETNPDTGEELVLVDVIVE